MLSESFICYLNDDDGNNLNKGEPRPKYILNKMWN